MTTTQVLEYQTPQAAPVRPVMYWYEKAYCVLAGIVLPVGCFVVCLQHYPAAVEWQSGSWYATISLMPAGPSAWPFYPLLAYAMVCMGLLVAWPVRFAQYFAVRLGLYGGVMLALQYTCIQAIAFRKPQRPIDAIIPCAIGAAVAAGILFAGWVISLIPWRRILRLVTRSLHGPKLGAAAVLLALLGALVLLVYAGVPVLLVTLIAAPALTLSAFAGASMLAVRLGAGSGRRRSQLLAVAWLAAYLGALRLSVAGAMAAYARLPTSAPNCFIATAAARGHRRFVRSSTCIDPDGHPFAVNDQLSRLKCFELLVARLVPRAHRRVRGLYNRLGPPLARRLSHPLAADAAYVLLKPAEWFAILAMQLVLPGWRRYADEMYHGPVQDTCKTCASQ